MSTADSAWGAVPSAARANRMRRQEMPASTSTRVSPWLTRMQLPEDPEARVVTVKQIAPKYVMHKVSEKAAAYRRRPHQPTLLLLSSSGVTTTWISAPTPDSLRTISS